MRSIRFHLLSLAAVLGLSMSANGEEIVRDLSPDGRFALQLSLDEQGMMFNLGLIDVASKKVLVNLDSLGNPYANHSHLLWSPDSKRVAYNQDNRRGGSTTIYQLQGDAFKEVELPDLPIYEPKHAKKTWEASLSRNVG